MRGTLFSAKAEYACIAMLELAARRGDPSPVRVKDIAEIHSVPKRFLVQILLQLKAAGLVASTRGAAGGYYLSRDPQNITMAEIVAVIDRREAPAEMRNAGGKMSLSPSTRAIHALWGEIIKSQQNILESSTLGDLLQRSQTFDMLYQI
jgi:Rrf2 family protein